ncbi:MAG: hypothetical protein GX348_10750 [Veillonellaceae bacterium]|jgi:membrane-associated HD superfamily phosphohydrolase|nr:hypothetical protein [Veillonellaceae bacterium]
MRYLSLLLGMLATASLTIAIDSFWESYGVSIEIAEIVSLMSAIPFIGLIFYLEGFFADNETYDRW